LDSRINMIMIMKERYNSFLKFKTVMHCGMIDFQFGKWVILPERGTCSHKNVFPLKIRGIGRDFRTSSNEEFRINFHQPKFVSSNPIGSWQNYDKGAAHSGFFIPYVFQLQLPPETASVRA